jgi:hypothetical protein
MAPNLPSFVITSSRLTNPGALNVDGASFSNVSTSGFTMDTAGSLYSCYYAQVTYSDADIIAAFNAAGNTLPYGQYGEGYLWNPSFYGTQEEVPPIAKVGYDWTNNKDIYILPLDSGDPGAFDPGVGNGTPLTGTYQFPAIFTAFEPFTDKGGWC